MKVAVIDNFDSFVYNLVRYIREENEGEVVVQRNNEIDFEVLDTCDAILLSPGPGIPSEAGQLKEVISRYYQSKKIIGICLGHQAIGEFFGGKLELCTTPFHGKMKKATKVTNDILFQGIDNEFETGRYHSWKLTDLIVEPLEITAVSEEGEVMAIRHKEYNICGVQFHPESILTPEGRKMMRNWIHS